jgi:AraC family transcriptional regulator of adaptative response / DNA-3-methyladenine glycosylase II
MNLDRQVCSRARLTRDARFDGKFFIAVLSTGIYCRPICPSRTSKEINVRYYQTAAAAAEAGFRPCLRCRPECSPGTPAWLGTPSTVSRALRLIGESGLEDGGVEVLAERLGVGSRHLRRLFLRHLGATPSAVAQTRRLHFAKKLIDETRLPMKDVAMAAGFGCVRRFNAAIRKVYHRPPTQLRNLAKQAAVLPENQYLFRLRYRPPYHWKAMLQFLSDHVTPGVEVVDADRYRRSISLNGNDGYFEVSLCHETDTLHAQVWFGDPRSLYFITERIRQMFDLNADWSAIVRSLRGDPLLARLLEAKPGLRLAGCWDGFEVAVRAILTHSIATSDLVGVERQLVERFGRTFSPASGLTHLFPEPEVLANCDLAMIGIPRVQAHTIRSLGRAVCDGEICFAAMIEVNVFLDRLSKIPGMREATAQYIAMRTMGETDTFPMLDAGLLRVTGLTNSEQLRKRAECWRPWRAYAAMYLDDAGREVSPENGRFRASSATTFHEGDSASGRPIRPQSSSRPAPTW